jgi:hypothetical protein
VFTARYALSPYIKQIHFVFEWLISHRKFTGFDEWPEKVRKFCFFLQESDSWHPSVKLRSATRTVMAITVTEWRS